MTTTDSTTPTAAPLPDADTTNAPRRAAGAKGATKRAKTAPTGATVLTVYAGPAATTDRRGRVLPVRPAAYPELVDEGELHCFEHKTMHPARSFGLIGTKGSGKGRDLVCRNARDHRLAENKKRRAEGKDLIPPWRATQVAPKPAEPKAPKKS